MEEARKMFKSGDILRHFKRETVNKDTSLYLYKFIDVATNTETKEKLAIYQSLYKDENKGVMFGELFARPLDMFMSKVDKDKYPDIKQEYRFEKCGGRSYDITR